MYMYTDLIGMYMYMYMENHVLSELAQRKQHTAQHMYSQQKY